MISGCDADTMQLVSINYQRSAAHSEGKSVLIKLKFFLVKYKKP